jgi:hypothetical protein
VGLSSATPKSVSQIVAYYALSVTGGYWTPVELGPENIRSKIPIRPRARQVYAYAAGTLWAENIADADV